MTATDELRAELTKRGVEWRKPAQEYWVLLGMPEGDSTTIVGELSIEEATDGTLVAYNLTPAQAIAATLGRGTCHLKPWEMERDTGFYDCMECDCGYVADVADWASWHFCPSCGRQNVGVDE